MTREKTWIIVLTWNASDRLHISLEALTKLEGKYHVLVVDNNSQDNTLEKAKSVLPDASFLCNSSNLGFAGGNNVGIRFALENGATEIVLVNDDLALDPDWLVTIQNHCKLQPDIGLAGGCIRFLEKPELINSTGLVVDSFWRATDRDFLSPFKNENLRKSGPVYALTGGAIWIRSEVFFKIGFLDEVFFAYYEDLDFCQRAKSSGFKLEYVSGATSFHSFAGSLGSDHPRRKYLLARNHLRIVGMYAPFLSTIFLFPAIIGYRICIKASISLFKLKPKHAFAEAKAVLDGSLLAMAAIWKRLF
jgi:GT2 family glycosyltransferase